MLKVAYEETMKATVTDLRQYDTFRRLSRGIKPEPANLNSNPSGKRQNGVHTTSP